MQKIPIYNLCACLKLASIYIHVQNVGRQPQSKARATPSLTHSVVAQASVQRRVVDADNVVAVELGLHGVWDRQRIHAALDGRNKGLHQLQPLLIGNPGKVHNEVALAIVGVQAVEIAEADVFDVREPGWIVGQENHKGALLPHLAAAARLQAHVPPAIEKRRLVHRNVAGRRLEIPGGLQELSRPFGVADEKVAAVDEAAVALVGGRAGREDDVCPHVNEPLQRNALVHKERIGVAPEDPVVQGQVVQESRDLVKEHVLWRFCAEGRHEGLLADVDKVVAVPRRILHLVLAGVVCKGGVRAGKEADDGDARPDRRGVIDQAVLVDPVLLPRLLQACRQRLVHLQLHAHRIHRLRLHRLRAHPCPCCCCPLPSRGLLFLDIQHRAPVPADRGAGGVLALGQPQLDVGAVAAAGHQSQHSQHHQAR
eukprot:m.52146 g.52146  ORF g.52146 m.52146 type:complete len:425 (+) comp13045_c0_seq1:445-1719(+)